MQSYAVTLAGQGELATPMIGDSALRESAQYVEPIFFTAAALLVLSGAGKLRNPNPAARALRIAGVSFAGPTAGRAIGISEVLAGILGLVAPRPAGAVVVGVAYMAFAGFLLFMARFRPAADSCGCLGKHDVAPNYIHAGLDVLGAVIGFMVLMSPGPRDALAMLRALGGEALLLVIALAALAYASYGAAAFLAVSLKMSGRISRPLLQGGRARQQNIDEILTNAGIGPDHPSLHGAIWDEAGRTSADEVYREIPLVESPS
jgi:hypothetical protein